MIMRLALLWESLLGLPHLTATFSLLTMGLHCSIPYHASLLWAKLPISKWFKIFTKVLASTASKLSPFELCHHLSLLLATFTKPITTKSTTPKICFHCPLRELLGQCRDSGNHCSSRSHSLSTRLDFILPSEFMSPLTHFPSLISKTFIPAPSHFILAQFSLPVFNQLLRII